MMGVNRIKGYAGNIGLSTVVIEKGESNTAYHYNATP
jgi:hypothetical protein